MNFSDYLIVSDLDGTLFNRHQQVPERSFRAIEYFKNNGGRFTFATGRAKMFIDKRFDFLKPLVNAPVILSNGARVYDYQNETELFGISFDRDFILSVLEKVYTRFPDLPMEIYTKNTVTVINPDERLRKRFEKLADNAKFCNALEFPNEDIIRIAVVDNNRERIVKASEFVSSLTAKKPIELVFSEWFIFEILPFGATKGNGINRLRKFFKDVKIVAVGDWNNDISQLVAADIPVCPSNANETVKEICKCILCDCDEGVIADIVENIEKGLF